MRRKPSGWGGLEKGAMERSKCSLVLYQNPAVPHGGALLTWDKDQVYIERCVDKDTDSRRYSPFS
jgi:hypothetical protein